MHEPSLERVELTERAAAMLRAAARAAGARELVMALGGQRRHTTARIAIALPLPNVARTDDHFEVTSPAFARAEHELRRRGHAWLGFAHSHPHGAPLLSIQDRRELWRGCVQLIVSPLPDGSIALRAFELAGDAVHSLPLCVHDRSTLAEGSAQDASAAAPSP